MGKRFMYSDCTIFSELAGVCGVKKKENVVKINGQIVKEMMINNGVDLSRFSIKRSDAINYRKVKRNIEGTDISMPCGITVKRLKQDFQDLVDDGKYSNGEPIVPQNF